MCNKHVSDIGSKASLFNKLCKVVAVVLVVVVDYVASIQHVAALKF